MQAQQNDKVPLFTAQGMRNLDAHEHMDTDQHEINTAQWNLHPHVELWRKVGSIFSSAA